MAACGQAARPTAQSQPAQHAQSQPDAQPQPADLQPATPATDWTHIDLVDVTGVSFTVSALKGKPVFVENFATWCSECLHQLVDTEKAAAAAADGATFVALSVETDIQPEDVARYAAKHGFTHIRFAVMSPRMLAATSNAFGTSAINPSSTPKIVVSATGQAGRAVTGYESAQDIAAKLDSAA